MEQFIGSPGQTFNGACPFSRFLLRKGKPGLWLQKPQPLQAQQEDFCRPPRRKLRRWRAYENSVIKGTVLSIEGDNVLIDVGLKSEGRVPLEEFGVPGQAAEIGVDVSSMSISNEWKIRTEKPSQPWTRAAEKLGRSLKSRLKRPSGSPGRSSDGSRAGSPSICRAPWPFCRAAGGCSPHSRCRPADGHAAAVPDPENGSPARQYRSVAPCRSGRIEGRTA